jgi:hypothetical protein
MTQKLMKVIPNAQADRVPEPPDNGRAILNTQAAITAQSSHTQNGMSDEFMGMCNLVPARYSG